MSRIKFMVARSERTRRMVVGLEAGSCDSFAALLARWGQRPFAQTGIKSGSHRFNERGQIIARLRAAIERTHELIKQGRYHAADAELEALDLCR